MYLLHCNFLYIFVVFYIIFIYYLQAPGGRNSNEAQRNANFKKNIYIFFTVKSCDIYKTFLDYGEEFFKFLDYFLAFNDEFYSFFCVLFTKTFIVFSGSLQGVS